MSARIWGPLARIAARQRRSQFQVTIALGIIIGLVAGCGAIIFYEAVDLATRLLLGYVAGYHPPVPLGEGSTRASGPERAWLLPVLTAAGGLASGIIAVCFAPEAAGHGTDAAIHAFHWKGGRVRWQVVPVKVITAALTIGSGGSAGREGPASQIGSGVGAVLADRFGLDAAGRRRALAAGMGAGIGAIFRAPLGGAMLAAEVLYRHDFEADVVPLCLVSSIVSYAVFGAYTDYSPVFGGAGDFSFAHPVELPYYALFGLLAGLTGLLYARVYYGTEEWFHRLAVPPG